MTRATRNRNISVSTNIETNIKINTRSATKSNKNRIKQKDVKTKPNSKKLQQDENTVPTTKSTKISNNFQSKRSVLGSKLHSARRNSIIRKSAVSAVKSPVLRDRTNTTSEFVNTDFPSKKMGDDTSKTSKQMKNVNISVEKNKKLQVSIKKYTFETLSVSKNNPKQNKLDEIKKVEPNIIKDNNEVKKLVSNTQQESQNLNVVKKKVHRRKPISEKDIKQLLDENEVDEIEFNKENEKKLKSRSSENTKNKEQNINNENENINSCNMTTESGKNKAENKKSNKKFFKNKDMEEKIKPIRTNRKNLQRQANNIKKSATSNKVQNNDSSFTIKLEEQKQSTNTIEKRLRPRINKNYFEVSKLSQNSSSTEQILMDEENATVEKDRKGIPIYKTIRLSQDSVKNKEEIYEFPDDSQEKDKKLKKKKKTIRKPITKRVKKTVTIQPVASKKIQTKPIKKIPLVQSKDNNKEPVNVKQVQIINIHQTNIMIPESFQNAGNSPIKEAPTIKILSDTKLDESKKINLTSTLPVPKTITSELKLLDSKNVITSQPPAQYSNMANHSLIRKSMSPIAKAIDNFDVGSPWRPINNFSCVQKIVQSTPCVNRLPLTREKKLPIQINLDKKSIYSEDTIHVSSIKDNKSSNNEKRPELISSVIESEKSPRKFGTEILNLNQSEVTHDKSNSKTLVESLAENNLQLQPKEPISSPAVVPEDSVELKENTAISEIHNKENTIPTPKKSPKKKFSTPSPFRFDRLRSSKKTVSAESQSLSKGSLPNKTLESNSKIEKPKSILRQLNLNNFLNLDEMPESTQISTKYGIFDDVNSTPISGKKPKRLINELSVENAFGFDDYDADGESSVIKNTSTPIIASEKDVKESIKGKLFLKARVKSALPSRSFKNSSKKELLKIDSKNKNELNDKVKSEVPTETNKNIVKEDKENENNNNKPDDVKKAVLDAVSFSDTFDILSENGEDLQTKVPDEMPLFVDLEPAHFTQPPRHSYVKRKRVSFNTSKFEEYESDEENELKPKSKKKKTSKLKKEEEKRLQQWVKSINDTFDEIEHYDLVIE